MKPFLSIVIKTYNEEAKIAKAIESALKVEAEIGRPVQVVVADSLSTDRTVEIAGRYPATIVQFTDPTECGCGAGVELGFRHARGEFVYFLDGDMEIVAGFVTEALQVLAADPQLAGVGGAVIDTQVSNAIDRVRINNKAVSRSGPCHWLEGGGLYRQAAIAAAGGYAADRNLKGYEEAELGMRLQAAGWKLCRLARVAVTHTGHSLDTWALLARHWRSRRAMSGGVLLRGAIGRAWLLRACRMLLHPLAIALWWCALPVLLTLAPASLHGALIAGWLAAFPLVFVALAIRKHDLHHAAISIASWHYGALATAIGLLFPRRPPTGVMAAQIVQDSWNTAGSALP